jgi:hypothetical protein
MKGAEELFAQMDFNKDGVSTPAIASRCTSATPCTGSIEHPA